MPSVIFILIGRYFGPARTSYKVELWQSPIVMVVQRLIAFVCRTKGHGRCSWRMRTLLARARVVTGPTTLSVDAPTTAPTQQQHGIREMRRFSSA